MKLTGAISILVPLVVFVIGLFIERTHRKTRWYRISVLALYVGVIFYLTILRRSIGSNHQIQLQPFWSYTKFHDPQYRWQIYMNVFLFVPFGFMLGWSINRRFFQAVIIGMVLSVCLEAMQYIFCLGLCELDDVFDNTLGTVIGYWYWRLLAGVIVRRKAL